MGTCLGLLVALVLQHFVTMELAVVGGWDAAALGYLMTIWPIIIRADSAHAEQIATREDRTRGCAAVLLVGASVVSLLGVGRRPRLCGAGERPPPGLTHQLSADHRHVVMDGRQHWLRAALRRPALPLDSRGSRLQRHRWAGAARLPWLRLRRLATGMTYQVSDTVIRDPRIRRSVPSHALLS
jgi:hypothetical protein